MQEFDDLCLRIRHAAEIAEATVKDIHQRIASLRRFGYLGDSLFLGDQIWQMPASDLAERDDLGTVYQPALWTAHGYGIVIWDTAEFLQLSEEFRLESEARTFFKKFGVALLLKRRWCFAITKSCLRIIARLTPYSCHLGPPRGGPR